MGRGRDSSPAGHGMTYVSVLGAFNSFVGGWILDVIKNHLLLYISRIYFFTNDL